MKKSYEEKENYILCLNVEDRKKHINPVLFKEFEKYHGDNTLFLGCNNGSSTTLLAPLCKKLVGLDINPKAIAVANQNKTQYKTMNVTYVCQNVMSLKLDEKFDCIYALQFLEHIYEDDMDIVLKNIKDVLTPEGYFIVQVPHQTGHHYDAAVHVTHFKDEKHIKTLLGKYFDIVSIVHETRKNPGMDGKHNDWTVVCKNTKVIEQKVIEPEIKEEFKEPTLVVEAVKQIAKTIKRGRKPKKCQK